MALMIAIATARDGCGRGDDDFLMMPEGAAADTTTMLLITISFFSESKSGKGMF